MSFEGPEVKGNFELNWNGIFTSFLSISFTVVVLALNVIIDDGPTGSSVILSELLKMQATFGVILVFVQFFFQTYKTKSIVKFFEALHEIDQKVN